MHVPSNGTDLQHNIGISAKTRFSADRERRSDLLVLLMNTHETWLVTLQISKTTSRTYIRCGFGDNYDKDNLAYCSIQAYAMGANISPDKLLQIWQKSTYIPAHMQIIAMSLENLLFAYSKTKAQIRCTVNA